LNYQNLSTYIDAVEQRAGNFRHILLNAPGRAGASVRGVTIVAAGTGVHGGHEHEGGRIGDGVLGTGDVDDAVLERLTQDFEDGT